MTNDSPQYFFDTFLVPNYCDWDTDQDNIRLAMNAAVSANQMADWCLIYWAMRDCTKIGNCSKYESKKFREHLASKECNDFAVIHDVADCYKYPELTRNDAKVSSAKAVSEGSLGWGEGGWGEGKWDGGPQLVIHFDNATKRAFSAPMKNVFEMWNDLLKRWGMSSQSV